ncbi:MAG: hypothetical protein ACE5NW_14145, partial [Acidiferrobacterales bacterium]
MRYTQMFKCAFLSGTITIACAVFIFAADVQAARTPSARSAVFPSAQDPVTLLTRDFVFLTKGSTLGMGTEVATHLTRKLNLRFGFDQFQDIDRRTEESVNYKLDLKLRSTSFLFDWHPFGGSFRTTMGMLINGSRLRATAVPTGTANIDPSDPSDLELAALLFAGGQTTPSATTLNASELVTAKGKVSFRTIAPYIGFGWGNATRNGGRLSYTVDIGLAFYGSPDVDLELDGMLADLVREEAGDELSAFLVSEEKQLERKLKGYDVFPVLSFGLSYR